VDADSLRKGVTTPDTREERMPLAPVDAELD
jgi:hypothetical protein